MKMTGAVCLALMATGFACQQKAGTESKNEVYYPVAGFISSQLSYIDSMPLAVMHYRTVGGHTDSAIMDKQSFAKIARSYSDPDPGHPKYRDKFEEKSFLDATLGTLTLSYTATTSDFPLRKVDVLLNAENSDVRSLYMEKTVRQRDTVRLDKIIWKPYKNCQIVSLTSLPGKPEMVEINRYVWDTFD